MVANLGPASRATAAITKRVLAASAAGAMGLAVGSVSVRVLWNLLYFHAVIPDDTYDAVASSLYACAACSGLATAMIARQFQSAFWPITCIGLPMLGAFLSLAAIPFGWPAVVAVYFGTQAIGIGIVAVVGLWVGRAVPKAPDAKLLPRR